MRKRRIVLGLGMAGVVAGCAAAKPANLGLVDQRLAACPDRPNCVSSQAEGAAVEPIRYEGRRDEARERLVALLDSMPGGRVVAVAPHYVRAEFTTKLLRFVDDVEAYLDPAEPVIHLRSASRLGYSDLGANRERVEAIRRRFSSSDGAPGAGAKKEKTG